MSIAGFTVKTTRLLTSCFTSQREMNPSVICNHQQLLFPVGYWLFTYYGFQVDIAPLSQAECIFSHAYLRAPHGRSHNISQSGRDAPGWSQSALQALAVGTAHSGYSPARQPPGTGAGQKVRAQGSSVLSLGTMPSSIRPECGTQQTGVWSPWHQDHRQTRTVPRHLHCVRCMHMTRSTQQIL